MAKLSYKQRQKLSGSDFAIPKERKYPIHNLSHARNALARVEAEGTPKERIQVRMAVYKRYKSLRITPGRCKGRITSK